MTPEELEALIERTVARVLAETAGDVAASGRFAFLEPEAAAKLGVRQHVLRDERLQGNIEYTKVGGRISYTPQHLIDYLARK